MLLGFAMWYSKIVSSRLGSYGPLGRLLIAIILLGLFSQPSLAEPDLIGGDLGLPSSAASNAFIDQDTAPAQKITPKLSAAEAAELVRRKVGGQVMSVNSRTSDTGVVYGVKVLNEGMMRTIHVDGQTGRLLNL
jgi:hypothetical protein